MDFRHIRAFIAVAEALSVTRAAERLHITQPAMTRHIHQLEDELGVALFVRHRQGVRLTEAGEELYVRAQALDAAASEFLAAARQRVSASSRAIRVGIGWGLWEVLNRLRIEFGKVAPDATIEAIDAYSWCEADEQLKNGALDVLITRPPFNAAFAISAPLFRERVQAVVSEDSPLAKSASLSIRELATEPLLMWERHFAPVLYDRVLDMYARAGRAVRTIPTPGAGPWNHAGMMLVASGKGVYLGYGVPLASPQSPSGVAVRPVSDPEAVTEICAVTRRQEASPLVAQFLQTIAFAFASNAGVTASVEVA